MFNSKQNNLFGHNKKENTSENSFINASLKESAKIINPQGSVKLKTTNNDFVDQFGNVTNYKKPRTYKEINNDMTLLWSQNKLLTLCFVFYLRMITRVVSLFNGVKTKQSQRGQGLKHEGIFRMLWIYNNAPDTFWKNITLFISIGSWKDIITMLSYDLQYNGWKNKVLDWDKFGKLILAGLENPNTSELLKKYLPQIKSNNSCKTLESQADNIIAKWICSLLFGGKTQEDNYKNYRSYRKLKSSGTAHEWQQLISKREMFKIDFNTIHGRALSQLVSSNFLKNQGLEKKYEEWISSKPVAKYTGYVYELFSILGTDKSDNSDKLKEYQKDTINKQFLQLVETGKNGMKKGINGLIVTIDSSSSMNALVPGTKVSAYSVAKSMALYFSYLLEGYFSNYFLEFSRDTNLKQWKGNTPIDKFVNEKSDIVGNTNFLSIATHFGKILKQGVKESEFPTGILCVSDGCFDGNNKKSQSSNFKALLSGLENYGFSKDFVSNFKVILWDIPNNYYGSTQTSFEEFANCPNLYHISGLDPAGIAFLTGIEGQVNVPKNSEELFLAAMNQEVLNKLEI